ncbi:MAG: HD domain-containing protein [Desulfobacteraceae bacterium]|nr:HD domain-containing protein [Desulfobacteraceae bacterium]
MTEAKKKFVADIKAGDVIRDLFALAEKNIAYKKDGKPFMTVTLEDRTGQIKGVLWDNVEQASSAAAGDFVAVNGSAGEYKGALQMVVKSMARVPAESVSPGDFLPVTTRDIEQMFARLRTLTESMSTPHLKALMDAFWNDDEFVRRFKKAPAAKNMHHAYIGGLLEHTLSMALLAERIAPHYGGINRDLLLVGTVVHDIGKVREFAYDHRIDYTDEGRLLSHIVIGVEMVEAKIRTIEGFPPATAALIKHMIISHHGAREFGSPELPKTIEAVLLNYVDEIDSRVNAIREFIAAEENDSSWTGYHRLLERQFFKG